MTLDHFLDLLARAPQAVLQGADLHDVLVNLTQAQEVPVATLAGALRPHLSPAEQNTLWHHAWRRAWNEARPDVAEAWKAEVMDRGNRPPHRVTQDWFSPASCLHQLSSELSLWRLAGQPERWVSAFGNWRGQTPLGTITGLINRPLGWHTTVLLWHLHHHPDLIAAVHRSDVGLDLDLPIHRWMGPHAGYLTGVPHDLGLRQRTTGAWTLLSVAVERGMGTTRDRGLWARTACGLIGLGASLDAPAWNGSDTVGETLYRWAETQPAPVTHLRHFEDQQQQALAILGRHAVLDLEARRSTLNVPEGLDEPPNPTLPRRRL